MEGILISTKEIMWFYLLTEKTNSIANRERDASQATQRCLLAQQYHELLSLESIISDNRFMETTKRNQWAYSPTLNKDKPAHQTVY